MAEYLAPGVYVEEVSYRSKSIEGVSTTTTGFVGPAAYGPLDIEPDIITSVEEFERIYGPGQQLRFGDGLVMHNYLWHGVRAFFIEGGKRLFISRVFRPLAGEYPPADWGTADTAAMGNGIAYDDGHARAAFPDAAADDGGRVQIRARFPGAAGNLLVRFTLRLGQNILGGVPGAPTLGALNEGDVVLISDQSSPIASPPAGGAFYVAEPFIDTVTRQRSWRFRDLLSPGTEINVDDLTPNLDPALSDQVRVVTLTVTITLPGGGTPQVWNNLALDPNHRLAGAPDSVTALFSQEPATIAQARSLPVIITLGDDLENGLDVLNALFASDVGLQAELLDELSSDVERSFDVLLEGGNDGLRPGAVEYEGEVDLTTNRKTGLRVLEDIEDISIVAAPGHSFGYDGAYGTNAQTIANLLIAHATNMRYRIAVLDSGDNQAISAVRAMRAQFNSKYAAFYYPWVRILDPITRVEIYIPPSGIVSGIYARNDVNRAVYKAPANEVVNLAIGFETMLNKAQQDLLNPEGVNCFRFFEGRGYLLWGARMATDDPEWKYVNLRRYFAYLERSIDRGTQWAVFEPNGDALWANIRRTIESFLYNEWVSGALLGEKPEKAFFVRCDRTTMTQNDLDNGRLVCLIGVAPVRPAEFVIFRIGQWTGDSMQ